MDYLYEIKLAGRKVSVNPDIWRTISEYVNSNQWFYIVHMSKMYRYTRTQSFFDRPAIYYFEIVTEPANEQIKYIFL